MVRGHGHMPLLLPTGHRETILLLDAVESLRNSVVHVRLLQLKSVLPISANILTQLIFYIQWLNRLLHIILGQHPCVFSISEGEKVSFCIESTIWDRLVAHFSRVSFFFNRHLLLNSKVLILLILCVNHFIHVTFVVIIRSRHCDHLLVLHGMMRSRKHVFIVLLRASPVRLPLILETLSVAVLRISDISSALQARVSEYVLVMDVSISGV